MEKEGDGEGVNELLVRVDISNSNGIIASRFFRKQREEKKRKKEIVSKLSSLSRAILPRNEQVSLSITGSLV